MRPINRPCAVRLCAEESRVDDTIVGSGLGQSSSRSDPVAATDVSARLFRLQTLEQLFQKCLALLPHRLNFGAGHDLDG